MHFQVLKIIERQVIMTIYKSRATRHFKWVIFLIVFMLGMTISFSDVYGVNIPSKSPENVNSTPAEKDKLSDSKSTGEATLLTDKQTLPDETASIIIEPKESLTRVPTSVPEPSTLILISSGLGLLYLRRKRKNS